MSGLYRGQRSRTPVPEVLPLCCLQFVQRFRRDSVFLDCDHARRHRLESASCSPCMHLLQLEAGNGAQGWTEKLFTLTLRRTLSFVTTYS